MTIQSSGPIKFSELQTEFGGSNPVSLSEYYAGGAYVPAGTSGVNGAVPTSGALALSKFYGTVKGPIFTPDGGTSAGSAVAIGNSGFTNTNRTISSNIPVVWTWTRTYGTVGSVSVASGGTAASITFNVNSSLPQTTVWSVSATGNGTTRYWTVTLSVEGNGGGGGGGGETP